MEHVSQEARREAGTHSAMAESVEQTRPAGTRRLPLSPMALLGLACTLAAVAVITLLVTERWNRHVSVPLPNSGPTLVSQEQLQRLAASTGQPVYWAGPQTGRSYELTRTAGGQIFVRYLPAGVRAGDPRPDFLVVGTYTQPGAFAALHRAARKSGTLSVRADDGSLVVFSSTNPRSVYFARPGSKYQVEVYSPSADTARRLVLAGKIRAIR